jgi:hypothetical protein
VDDDFVSAFSPISRFLIARIIWDASIIISFATSEDTRYSDTKGSRLIPAAIGKRRVIGSR